MIKSSHPNKGLNYMILYIYNWHGWFSGKVEEYDGKDCWYKS